MTGNQQTAAAASGIIDVLSRFADAAAAQSMTPKAGDCLRRLADQAESGSYRQVIVTGHRVTAAAAASFLVDLGKPMICVTAAELASR